MLFGEAEAIPGDLKVRWRRRGPRTFDADKNAAATAAAPRAPSSPPAVESPAR